MRAFPGSFAVACLALAAASCGVSAIGDPDAVPAPAASAPAASPVPAATPPGPSSSPVRTEPGVVVRVVDGDTAHIRLARSGTVEKVRFIGINTPESTIRHEPYGSEASAFTKRRLAGATVHLETDAQLRDRYGRLLAYVWMRPPGDGGAADVASGMFNATLLIEGFAHVATYPPNVRYVEVFRVLERAAREANRGLWGLPG